MALETVIKLIPDNTIELTLEGEGDVHVTDFIQTTVIQSEITVGIPGKPGKDGSIENLSAAISDDAGNALDLGTDDKLYVPDDIASDPLAYYILAKG